MPPLTSSQKGTLAQFVGLTGTNDKTAQRFLKNTNFRLEVALDQYYSASQNASQSSNKAETALSKLFDSLQDPSQDPDKDTIGVDSMMRYLDELGVNPESCEIFVVLEIVKATGFGQITRQGYIEGWKATGANHTLASHKQYVQKCMGQLSTQPAYFKKVYRNAFIAGKEPDQKSLSLENAIVYWEMLFNPPGSRWASATTDWLDAWKRFLEENWTHSVNKDMWNQTLEFSTKSLADESLSFWSEDSAWPSVIDQFVMWCRTNNVGKAGTMEVD